MVYFLQKTVRVHLDKSEKLDWMSLQMIDTRKFLAEMKELETRTFAMNQIVET